MSRGCKREKLIKAPGLKAGWLMTKDKRFAVQLPKRGKLGYVVDLDTYEESSPRSTMDVMGMICRLRKRR